MGEYGDFGAEGVVLLLLRPVPENPQDLTEGPPLAIRTGLITMVEVKRALKRLKNGKAAGCDKIPPEALKERGLVSAKVLHSLLNKIWTAEDIPQDWRLGLLVKLPKKGDLSLRTNWRGIMLLTISSKVLCRIILERMKDALDSRLRDEQGGFRKERSCCDKMATLRIIVEQTLEWNTSLYMVFIDFQKAFDSIIATRSGRSWGTTGFRRKLSRWSRSSTLAFKQDICTREIWLRRLKWRLESVRGAYRAPFSSL